MHDTRRGNLVSDGGYKGGEAETALAALIVTGLAATGPPKHEDLRRNPPPKGWRTALRTGKPMPNRRKPSRQMEIWREIRRGNEDLDEQWRQAMERDDKPVKSIG